MIWVSLSAVAVEPLGETATADYSGLKLPLPKKGIAVTEFDTRVS